MFNQKTLLELTKKIFHTLKTMLNKLSNFDKRENFKKKKKKIKK